MLTNHDSELYTKVCHETLSKTLQAPRRMEQIIAVGSPLRKRVRHVCKHSMSTQLLRPAIEQACNPCTCFTQIIGESRRLF
jgi:hypothetical protein